MAVVFEDFDVSAFWEDSDYAREEYVGAALTPSMVGEVEGLLGVSLPASYLELMRTQNGGMPRLTCHAVPEPTSWAPDHVAITGIFGVDSRKPCSLCGEAGAELWFEEWGYPRIGVYFADCPSAGHDMLCLDYRACGPTGEPTVVHVDQEDGYRVTAVAPTFESFIRGLATEEAFD